MTLSIGVAIFPEQATSAEELIRQAESSDVQGEEGRTEQRADVYRGDGPVVRMPSGGGFRFPRRSVQDKQDDARHHRDVGHVEDVGAQPADVQIHEVYDVARRDAVQDVAEPASHDERAGDEACPVDRPRLHGVNRDSPEDPEREQDNAISLRGGGQPAPRLPNAPVFSA